MGDYARGRLDLDDEDRLPWLEPALDEADEERISPLRLLGLIILGLVLIGASEVTNDYVRNFMRGTVDLLVDAGTTAAITWSGGVHDLEIVHPGGEVTRLLLGRLLLEHADPVAALTPGEGLLAAPVEVGVEEGPRLGLEGVDARRHGGLRVRGGW